MFHQSATLIHGAHARQVIGNTVGGQRLQSEQCVIDIGVEAFGGVGGARRQVRGGGG